MVATSQTVLERDGPQGTASENAGPRWRHPRREGMSPRQPSGTVKAVISVSRARRLAASSNSPPATNERPAVFAAAPSRASGSRQDRTNPTAISHNHPVRRIHQRGQSTTRATARLPALGCQQGTPMTSPDSPDIRPAGLADDADDPTPTPRCRQPRRRPHPGVGAGPRDRGRGDGRGPVPRPRRRGRGGRRRGGRDPADPGHHPDARGDRHR